MPKRLRAPKEAATGVPPRLVQGPWQDICAQVAGEIDGFGAGRIPKSGDPPAPSVAILLFSTSERTSRNGTAPALDLRRALEARGLRVYNPRNKTAAAQDSPVAELLGLLSYLIDPVTKGAAGAKGNMIEVWASCNDAHKASFALSAPPPFAVSTAHAAFQKRFRKNHGTLDSPNPDIAPLIDYIDEIREQLVKAVASRKDGGKRSPRLTLAGLVARLLTFDRYREAGFTRELFREALFTRLLEAQVAATRLTRNSLDAPLEPERRTDNRIEWPDRYWSFLNIFGSLLDNTALDDIEVDSFADNAIGLLTFHQAKGLEFDHVYVGLTGRDAAPNPALRTKLFSGEAVAYHVEAGQPVTTDRDVQTLSEADREREIYVALTRARERLTVIQDPADRRPLASLNEGLETLFKPRPRKPMRGRPTLRVAEFK
jgi:DNA helicase-2/ATP-dependent DNA helicase PcrA